MNNIEIRQEIDRLTAMLEEIISPSKFTLNNLVVEISTQIESIQSQCQHEFQDGFCIYCDKMNPENDVEEE